MQNLEPEPPEPVLQGSVRVRTGSNLRTSIKFVLNHCPTAGTFDTTLDGLVHPSD